MRITGTTDPAARGVLGVAVLLVVLQGTGGFAVELLGPDILLAAAGFLLTRRLLTAGAADGRPDLGACYRALAGAIPLVVAVAALAVLVSPRGGRCDPLAGFAAIPVTNLVAIAVPGCSGPVAGIDPLGSAWLIAVLVQLGAIWPLVVAGAWWAGGHRRRHVVVPVVIGVLCLAAASVVAIRSVLGAGLPELALGTHVRAVEWLLGAFAAAVVTGRRSTPVLGNAPAVAATVIGGTLLVLGAVVASVAGADWLRYGGPAAAAFAAAIVLAAVTSAPGSAPAAALGRGLPHELGVSAFPLLVLHLVVFRLVQLAVPDARPFALLVVGGVLTWLVGLIVQDGVLRRLLAGPRLAQYATWTVVLGAVAALGAGSVQGTAAAAAAPAPAPGSAVLLLGGRVDLAVTAPGGVPLVDATDGCGLLPRTLRGPDPVRTSAAAQIPPVAPLCGDRPERWTELVTSLEPVAVVVDLRPDRDPAGGRGPCTAAFRPAYRTLLDRALEVWVTGDPARPVLLLLGPPDEVADRCLDAVLVDVAERRPALATVAAADDPAAALAAALDPAARADRLTRLRAACPAGPTAEVPDGC